MNGKYEVAAVEAEWQAYWEREQTFRTPNPGEPGFDPSRPKYFCLDFFPYPSGAGLHVGHPEGYTATDVLARHARMRGCNVLHPMGWDAFGLPAEQYAIETNTHPSVTTARNVANFKRQLKSLGFSYDWSRELSTTDPDYYRWTQWIFLRLFDSYYDTVENRARPIADLVQKLNNEELMVQPDGSLSGAPLGGLQQLTGEPGASRYWHELTEEDRRAVLDSARLAYVDESPVNWCPALGTVLANEEVTNDGRSERGNHPVFRRPLRQWMLRITAYAERLIADLDLVDWPPPVKLMQRNWIGRSEGARVRFEVLGSMGLLGGTGVPPVRLESSAPPAPRANHRLEAGATNGLEAGATIGPEAGAPAEDDTGPAIEIFTTRPDTLYGATYMVLSPEHPFVDADDPEFIVADAWPAGTPDAWRGALSGIDGASAFATPREAVRAYQTASGRRTERDRAADAKVKTGVFTGAYARNPVFPPGDPRSRIPIFIADYVLMGYGTGAIMAVPGHDTRDLEFAAAFGLPVVQVVAPPDGIDWRGYVEDGGVGFNSPPPDLRDRGDFEPCRLNGLERDAAKRAVIEWLESRGLGRFEVTYKLRDWLFSRQRYWGEPFPVVHGEDGGVYAIADDELPVALPEMADFRPQSLPEDSAAEPEPPLARAREWMQGRVWIDEHSRAHAVAPGGADEQRAAREGRRVINARRETNTMPQWAGSCWYYLRFCDPRCATHAVSPAAEQYWMVSARRDGRPHSGGVDLYLGGTEHAVLHLLYARFWHKVLFDLGVVSTPEPFGKLFNQGMIRAFCYRDARGVPHGYEEIDFRDDGAYLKESGEKLAAAVEKMSKTLKNVINPDDVVKEYGADSLRLYELFMGPLDQSKPWNPRDVPGVFRFLQRVWRLVVDPETGGLNAKIGCGAGFQPVIPNGMTAPQPHAHAEYSEGMPPDQPHTHTKYSESMPPDALERALHRTIKKVTEDLDRMAFNTAISAMMEFANEATSATSVRRDQLERFVLILAPFAPHLCEELWKRLRGDAWKTSLAYEPWPTYDDSLTVESQLELPVQVNGKMRSRISVARDANERAVELAALSDAKVIEALAGKTVRKVVVVQGRLVNVVAG